MHAARGGKPHGDVNGPSAVQLLVLTATTYMGVLADSAKAQQVAVAAKAFLEAKPQ
jgi:hypothetical protein